MSDQQRKKIPKLKRVLKICQTAWKRFSLSAASWLGALYITQPQRSSHSSRRGLKSQIQDVAFDTIKRIKIFSLFIRVLICFLLFIIVGIDVFSNLYTKTQAFVPLAILTVYSGMIVLMLRSVLHTTSSENLKSRYDFLYITAEIVAVYLAIVFFPTHPANMYSTSLKGLWSLLIVLATFTGKWYYGIFSGTLVALLNASLAFYYSGVALDFTKHGLDLNQIDPYVQIFIRSGYYFLQGALLGFPFFLFERTQSTVMNMKVEQIVAQPYYDLFLKDGSYLCGEYLIHTTSSSSDIVGADFVALKQSKGEYALIVGDVIGHGLNRSPGAIMCMSVFKSLYTIEPLYIQESINRLMQDLDVTSGGKVICTTLKLGLGGKLDYAGKIDEMRLIHDNQATDLHSLGEVLGVTPELVVTQTKSIVMDPGDTIYIKTDGVYEAEDDKTVVIIKRVPVEELESVRALADKIC